MQQRWALVGALVIGVIGVARAEPQRVDVLCTSGRCEALALPGTGRVSVRVRFDAPRSVAPVLRAAPGAPAVKLAPCADSPGGYCGIVAEAIGAVIAFDGSEHVIESVLSGAAQALSTDERSSISRVVARSKLPAEPSAPGPLNNGTEVPDPEVSVLKAGPHGSTILIPDPEPKVGPAPPVPLPPTSRSGAIDDVSFADVVGVGFGPTFHCTGVVVASRVVLTAGHCAPADRVVVGSRVTDSRVVPVRAAVSSPEPAIDAALLVLDRPLPVAPRSRRKSGEVHPPPGQVRVLGFGVENFRAGSGFGVKRAIDVSAHGWGCDGQRPTLTGCDPRWEMVISDTVKDTCDGDSGGPVLEAAGDSWRLIALTSRALTSRRAGCGPGGVYIRVDVISDWMDSVVRNNP